MINFKLKYSILILFFFSVKGSSQEKTDSLVILNLNSEKYFTNHKILDLNLKYLKNNISSQPHHKKIDINNPNFPKYNYDIYNPNKSNSVVDFVLNGITNLF